MPDDRNESSALEQSIAVARQNQQVAIWDRRKRPYALGVYDSRARRVRPLSDEQAGIILNRDPLIRREWRKWNAMSQNSGSLIVLDAERALRVLAASTEEPDGDDEVRGLA